MRENEGFNTSVPTSVCYHGNTDILLLNISVYNRQGDKQDLATKESNSIVNPEIVIAHHVEISNFARTRY